MSDGTKEVIERRTEDAFARSAWQDPRVEYRAMLRRLREQDPAAFESAVRDYESAVVARLADAGVDPVEAWLSYGERLAGVVGGGRLVRIDAAGRALDRGSSDEDAAPSRPLLLLHLPAAESAPAIVVACPREPTAAQEATLALLVDGRTAVQES